MYRWFLSMTLGVPLFFNNPIPIHGRRSSIIADVCKKKFGAKVWLTLLHLRIKEMRTHCLSGHHRRVLNIRSMFPLYYVFFLLYK